MNTMKWTLLSILFVFIFVNLAFSQPDTVWMVNYDFQPKTIEISKGDTIIWINKTRIIHTSTSGGNCSHDGMWDSGNLQKGESFTWVFTEEGSFPYYCIPHCRQGMTGVVKVIKHNLL